jgi:hypothetical protein
MTGYGHPHLLLTLRTRESTGSGLAFCPKSEGWRQAFQAIRGKMRTGWTDFAKGFALMPIWAAGVQVKTTRHLGCATFCAPSRGADDFEWFGGEMSFLILLIPSLIWLTMAWFLARLLVSSVSTQWIRIGLHSVFFFSIAITPIVDEIIGRERFAKLCEERAVLTVSPDWQQVERASKVTSASEIITNRIIPIFEKRIAYSDLDTDKVFVSYPILRFGGGFIYRYIFGDGGGRECSLSDENYLVMKKMDLEKLLKNGKSK